MAVPLPAPLALTQTLDSKYFKHKAKAQLEKLQPQLEILLKECCYYYTIQAELTQQSNIHWHGTVTFKSEIHKAIYCDKARHFGRQYKLIKIGDIKGWNEYITKDTAKTMEVLGLPLNKIRKEYSVKQENILKALEFQKEISNEINNIEVINDKPTVEVFKYTLLRDFDEHFKSVYDMDIECPEYIYTKAVRDIVRQCYKSFDTTISVFVRNYQGNETRIFKGTDEKHYYLVNAEYFELKHFKGYGWETRNPA